MLYDELCSKSPQELIQIWQDCHIKIKLEDSQDSLDRFNIWVQCCKLLRTRGYYLDVGGKHWISMFPPE